MQEIIINLKTGDVVAEIVDEYNQSISVIPTITRGMRVLLRLRLFDLSGNIIPIEKLEFASWDFVLANDWNTTTAPQVRVQENIAVQTTNEDDKSFTEMHIPLTETNTSELIEALGNSPSIQLGAELAGFEAGEAIPGFLMQFDLNIRNRRGTAGTGIPEPVGDGIYSASQVDALLITRAELNHVHDDLYSPLNHDHNGIYQQEDIGRIYNRAASVLASMMLFVRNGAVNAYLTLNDIREWLKNTFSETGHNHDSVYSDIHHEHDYSNTFAAIEHQHGIKCAMADDAAIGSLVKFSDSAGTLTCNKVGMADRFADGFIAAIENDQAIVKAEGICNLSNTVYADAELFLGVDGGFQAVPPANSGELVQKVGRVIDADTIYFYIQPGRIIA